MLIKEEGLRGLKEDGERGWGKIRGEKNGRWSSAKKKRARHSGGLKRLESLKR